MCRTSHTSYAFSLIEMHRRENKEGFLCKLWWTSQRLLQCSQCKENFRSISHTYVQQKLAIHTKIHLHQKGSHTTCLKYIKRSIALSICSSPSKTAQGTNKTNREAEDGNIYQHLPHHSPQHGNQFGAIGGLQAKKRCKTSSNRTTNKRRKETDPLKSANHNHRGRPENQ